MKPIENMLIGKEFKTLSAERKYIFSEMRKIDDSHLCPICNKFNATERAINRLRKFEREYGDKLAGLGLILFLDNEISNIVNDPNI